MLIEIVVAIGIIGLVLVGVSDLMTRSVSVASFQKQKEEAITIIKKILNDYKSDRDTNPDGFYAAISGSIIDPCKDGLPYRCLVTVSKNSDSVTITVTAEWEDGGKTYKTALTQSLSRTIK